jgi:2-C-methyl-D-erythritol 2,4-cyclodiphosphate synthase
MAPPRIGIGVDVHPFASSADEEQPLQLAGLAWPGERRLAGHSDGDVVAHAACDALLAAAGLGDLGTQFGTDRPEWSGASGTALLAQTAALIRASGFQPGNVSVQLIGNRPRLAERRGEAEDVLTAALGAPVAVSATTTDGLGFTGRGEGLAAVATALILEG